MEDVLELYAAPLDPHHPVVCVDERPVQLLSHVRDPLPAHPGQVRRWDFEYQREGTANLFMLFQPLTGWRTVKATAQRKKADFAYLLQELVDIHFPNAERIRVVLDNLNIHSLAVLYATFPPEEARRIASRLEFHHTPKHGSWLNMAEIEFSILSRQCLGQRIPALADLHALVTAWTAARNATRATVRWSFSLTDARHRLNWLYRSQ
jgi:hypothetical protein